MNANGAEVELAKHNIGHIRPFFQDSNALLSQARLYFGNTKEPFALTIAGSTTYVITRAQDVAEAYRNNSTLSWTDFLLELMRGLGNDELCVEAVANPLPRSKEGFPNPHGKPLVTLARDMHIHQLHPGEQLDDLERRFLRCKRTGNAWFTDAFEAECRAVGIIEEQIAIMFFTVYWGANTNTRRAAYWLLAHLLDTPGLLASLRAETNAAFNEDGHLNPAHLHDASNNQCFESVWNETIRMSAYASSVRYITRDTTIGGKILRQGHRLMIPYRQLHFDEDVFGPSVDEFRPERFGFNIAATCGEQNKGSGAHRNLTRGDSWRPFGGGVTMCPGRYIAKRSVHMFMALLLHRYDVESVGQRTVPEPEMGKPVLGIMSVKDGSGQVRVRLTPRNSK